MSFELLLKPLTAEKKPWVLFLFTILIASLAIILSYNIFPRSASVLLITFSIIPLIPIMTKLIEMEELKLERAKKWYSFKNYRILKVYAFLFIGFVIAFSAWYTFLPSEKSDQIFKEQIYSLYERDPLTSDATNQMPVCDSGILSNYINDYKIADCKVVDYKKDGIAEYLIITEDKQELVLKTDTKEFIPYKKYIRGHYFFHNLNILIFIFLTSFIFGSGALFVLVWNASIIGVYIGEIAHRLALFASFGKLSAYFTALPISMWRLLLHGIPEFLGFFVAAFAGGILSVSIIRHSFLDKRSLKIMIDASILFGFSVALIALAAFLESL